jgi:hypothetical protein
MAGYSKKHCVSRWILYERFGILSVETKYMMAVLHQVLKLNRMGPHRLPKMLAHPKREFHASADGRAQPEEGQTRLNLRQGCNIMTFSKEFERVITTLDPSISFADVYTHGFELVTSEEQIEALGTKYEKGKREAAYAESARKTAADPERKEKSRRNIERAQALQKAEKEANAAEAALKCTAKAIAAAEKRRRKAPQPKATAQTTRGTVTVAGDTLPSPVVAIAPTTTSTPKDIIIPTHNYNTRLRKAMAAQPSPSPSS